MKIETLNSSLLVKGKPQVGETFCVCLYTYVCMFTRTCVDLYAHVQKLTRSHICTRTRMTKKLAREICKEFLQLNNENPNNPIKYLAKT